MRESWLRALTLIGPAALALALVPSADAAGLPATSLAAVAAVIAFAAAVIVATAPTRFAQPELTVGHRARGHRESLRWMTAPRHPNTAGRPRTRAPAEPYTA